MGIAPGWVDVRTSGRGTSCQEGEDNGLQLCPQANSASENSCVARFTRTGTLFSNYYIAGCHLSSTKHFLSVTQFPQVPHK